MFPKESKDVRDKDQENKELVGLVNTQESRNLFP